MMDIDNRKQQMISQLQALRKECELLIERTYAYEEDLLKVKTEEDAKVFDSTHDLEEGFDIIRLF